MFHRDLAALGSLAINQLSMQAYQAVAINSQALRGYYNARQKIRRQLSRRRQTGGHT
jgi:hypothetical protein